MFLKSCFRQAAQQILLGTVLLCSSLAGAESGPGINPGLYKRVAGDHRFCPEELQLTENALSQKNLRIGAHFVFEWRRSSSKMESDIDPGVCEFLETTDREDRGGETLLTRINSEVCRNVVKSKTESELRFQGGRIELQHRMDQGSGQAIIRCEWSLRNSVDQGSGAIQSN